MIISFSKGFCHHTGYLMWPLGKGQMVALLLFPHLACHWLVHAFSSSRLQGSSWPSVMREECDTLFHIFWMLFSLLFMRPYLVYIRQCLSILCIKLARKFIWVFHLNILQKKLNGPFDQPNKRSYKVLILYRAGARDLMCHELPYALPLPKEYSP